MTIPPDQSDRIYPGTSIKGGPASQAPGTGFQSFMPESTQGAPKSYQAQAAIPIQAAQALNPRSSHFARYANLPGRHIAG